MPTTLGDDDGAREVDLIHEVGDRDVRQNAPMRSISKTVVSQDIAAAIVADAFGPNVALVEFNEATEGWFNAAYRLGLDDGRQAVLKVAPPPEVTVMRYEHDLMATEVAALQLAGERTAIPVPAVLWSDTSCRRVPSSLFVMERCFGVLLSELRPTLDAEQQEHIDAQLAVHLRQLHDITHTGFGLGAPSAPSFDSWGDCFAHLIDDLLADREAKDVDLGIADDRVRSLIAERRAALDEVTVRRFVHWDLWDSNVFIDPETLAVSGVIDFERALWADPLMEAQFYTKASDASFIAAYGSAMVTIDAERERRLLYDLYLFLIMVIEGAYRHYGDDTVETIGRDRLRHTLVRLGEL
ncbi:MAG: aminoglycoside phosphotransferase family protein [Acidimicrobiales bacterium]